MPAAVDNPIYKTVTEELGSTKIEVLAPGIKGYEESLHRWSDSVEKPAAAVALPTTTEEVSTLMKLFKSKKIDFAVKCGGHSTSGASSIEHGVVVDLKKMRNTSVDVEKKTITAQGGCLWEDVDRALAKHKLGTPGGTVNHTGIGGLTLGGGFGWLSGRYGMVVDNLLAATMVLADGSIKKASETENPDLFWAIRGAGSCFGVCTEFVYQAHDYDYPMFGGLIAFTPDKLPALANYANLFHEKVEQDQGFVWGVGAMPPTNMPTAVAALWYKGTEQEAKEWFKELYDIGPVAEMTSAVTYDQLNSFLNPGSGHGGRRTRGAGALRYPLSEEVAMEIMAEFPKFIMENGGEEYSGSIMGVLMIPYKKVNEVPMNATAYANRGDYYNMELSLRWNDPANDSKSRDWARGISAKVKELSAIKDHEGVGVYAGTDDNDSRAKKWFGSNLGKLRELKQKFDPDNVFSKWCDLLQD